MGKLSEIFTSYRKSLDSAQEDYENSVKNRSGNAKSFYEEFFKTLIVNYGKELSSKEYANGVMDQIKNFFGKMDLNFVAVDGSCDKHNSNEFISFYGGAYGARGSLSLSENPPRIEYKKWEIEKDVSMVAFVPIPYSHLEEITDPQYEETFLMSESEKVEIASIHLPIMQLAEIFLAYNSATSSNLDSPDMILLDNNVSGILGLTDFGPKNVDLVGYPFESRNLTIADAAVAQAHPFNSALGIPSTKIFSVGFAVIKFFHENQNIEKITLQDIEKNLGIDKGTIHLSRIRRLAENEVIEFDESTGTITKKVDPWKSWEYTKHFFQTICKGIFLDKRDNALKYPAKDEQGNKVMRWMKPRDVNFLIAIGVRALIEVCWEKKILLAGVVKDSASRYLTRNYLGVCKLVGTYPKLSSMKVGSLPPTDRLLCELLPYLDDELRNPWGTIEFDSTFMTLHAENDGKQDIIAGTLGGITRPERLFLRSIAQFYTRRKNDNILTGHAIFIDRLAFPEWDLKYAKDLEVEGNQVGKLVPFIYPDNKSTNIGQAITYFLLDLVTKNHFPEVIGYPDPLHKADWGAKSMQKRVKKLLESSESKFRSRPLTNTLREIRQSFRR